MAIMPMRGWREREEVLRSTFCGVVEVAEERDDDGSAAKGGAERVMPKWRPDGASVCCFLVGRFDLLAGENEAEGIRQRGTGEARDVPRRRGPCVDLCL